MAALGDLPPIKSPFFERCSMTFRAVFLVALFVLPLGTLPSLADVPAEFAGRGCTFWDSETGDGEFIKVVVRHTDDGGRSYNQLVLKIHPDRDNNISALSCDGHCSAALYDRPQRGGGEIFTIDGQAGFISLRNNGANNRTSSLSVYCAR
ncbi:MAG: hypothetical protein JWP26_2939 [Devosia sp.]|nr:hypothetical protein [Devosia sp.]